MDAAEEALAIVRVRAWLRSGRAREVRKRAGLSQSDVGRAVGTDHAQVSRWESGMYAPRRDSALALAALYEQLECLAIEAAADAVASQQDRGVTEVAPGAVTAELS